MTPTQVEKIRLENQKRFPVDAQVVWHRHTTSVHRLVRAKVVGYAGTKVVIESQPKLLHRVATDNLVRLP
jgi:hypothetical protein